MTRRFIATEPLGFLRPTAVRGIGYADALRFGELHREVYEECGFELVNVPALPEQERAGFVAKLPRLGVRRR